VTEAKSKTKTKTAKSKSAKPAPKAARLTVPSPEKLLEAGVHFGHLRKRWHPRMAPYIFTEKDGVHVFDLYQTQEKLKEAAQFLRNTAGNGGKALFVGTKRQAAEIVEREAKRAGAFYVTSRWLGGTLTNFDSVWGNVEKLEDLAKKVKGEELEHLTKKEQLMIDREIAKLEAQVGGLRGMSTLPDALVLASAKGEETAAREAQQKGIPVIAITDTNADPDLVDYVIPGNDDSASSIEIIFQTLATALEAGKKK